MKNLHDIIQKNMEEFERLEVRISSPNSEGDVELWKRMKLLLPTAFDLMKPDIKKFLLSSQLSIIQAIDEWAEKKLQDKEISNGYYNAINDLRSFLSGAKGHNNKL